MFAPSFFTPRYFAPRYFSGTGAVTQSSWGDGVPIWIGIPPPAPIPTLSLVGNQTQVPIWIPIHERESAHVWLGTLHVRVVREIVTSHLREAVVLACDQQIHTARWRGHERSFFSCSLTEVARARREWSDQGAVQLENVYHISEEVLISEHGRAVRSHHEHACLPLMLEASSRTLGTMYCLEHMAIPWISRSAESVDQLVCTSESFAIRIVYTLTYQPSLTAPEVAALVAAMDLAA